MDLSTRKSTVDKSEGVQATISTKNPSESKDRVLCSRDDRDGKDKINYSTPSNHEEEDGYANSNIPLSTPLMEPIYSGIYSGLSVRFY